MPGYNLTTAILGLAAAVGILVMVRRNVLYLRYSFWWLAAALLIVVLGFFPRITDVMAEYLGVSYPPTLALSLAVVLLLLKNLVSDIEISQQEMRIRRLAQRLAILDQQITSPGEAADAPPGDETAPCPPSSTRP